MINERLARVLRHRRREGRHFRKVTCPRSASRRHTDPGVGADDHVERHPHIAGQTGHLDFEDASGYRPRVAVANAGEISPKVPGPTRRRSGSAWRFTARSTNGGGATTRSIRWALPWKTITPRASGGAGRVRLQGADRRETIRRSTPAPRCRRHEDCRRGRIAGRDVEARRLFLMPGGESDDVCPGPRIGAGRSTNGETAVAHMKAKHRTLSRCCDSWQRANCLRRSNNGISPLAALQEHTKLSGEKHGIHMIPRHSLVDLLRARVRRSRCRSWKRCSRTAPRTVHIQAVGEVDRRRDASDHYLLRAQRRQHPRVGAQGRWGPVHPLADTRNPQGVSPRLQGHTGIGHPASPGGHSGADTWLTAANLKAKPGAD